MWPAALSEASVPKERAAWEATYYEITHNVERTVSFLDRRAGVTQYEKGSSCADHTPHLSYRLTICLTPCRLTCEDNMAIYVFVGISESRYSASKWNYTALTLVLRIGRWVILRVDDDRQRRHGRRIVDASRSFSSPRWSVQRSHSLAKNDWIVERWHSPSVAVRVIVWSSDKRSLVFDLVDLKMAGGNDRPFARRARRNGKLSSSKIVGERGGEHDRRQQSDDLETHDSSIHLMFGRDNPSKDYPVFAFCIYPLNQASHHGY